MIIQVVFCKETVNVTVVKHEYLVHISKYKLLKNRQEIVQTQSIY